MAMHMLSLSPSSIHVADTLSNLLELTQYASEWHYDKCGTITAIVFEEKNQTSSIIIVKVQQH